MQKFVSVALHTSAGEGDYSSDRLSNLKIVGSGYGSLIYKLQQTSNFESFKLYCEEVWKALEQNPNLPTLLVIYNIFYYTSSDSYNDGGLAPISNSLYYIDFILKWDKKFL